MEHHQNLTQAIETARATIAQKNILERRLTTTESNLQSARLKVKSLQEAYEKEAKDVEKMNRLSFSSFVATLLNTKAERLEKEEIEALEAKKSLDSAHFDVMALESEFKSLQDQVWSLADAPKQYQAALEAKLNYLKIQDPSASQVLEDLENQMQVLTQQKIEIAEAIDACQSTHDHLKTVVGVLSEAKSWSTYDMVGGGMFATMVKRDKMDQAKHQMDGLNLKIQRLNQELADIATLNVAHMDLDGMRLSDYLFDCFFVDLAVHQRIVDAIEKLHQLENKLLRLKDQLQSNLNEASSTLTTQQDAYQEHIEKL